jgi:hypothetical protein
VRRQATARANLGNLLEDSKGDLAKTDASLFILHRLDNGLAPIEVVSSTEQLSVQIGMPFRAFPELNKSPESEPALWILR